MPCTYFVSQYGVPASTQAAHRHSSGEDITPYECSKWILTPRSTRFGSVRSLAGSSASQGDQPDLMGLTEHAAWHLGRTVPTMLRNRRWPTAGLNVGGTRSSATGSRRPELTELIGELAACDPRGLEMAGVEVNRAVVAASPSQHVVRTRRAGRTDVPPLTFVVAVGMLCLHRTLVVTASGDRFLFVLPHTASFKTDLVGFFFGFQRVYSATTPL